MLGLNRIFVVLLLVGAGAADAALDRAAYEQALGRARDTRKPVVIVAAAPAWEEASAEMVARLAEPALEGWLASEAVAIRLDPSQEGPDPEALPFAGQKIEELGIRELPSLLVLDAGGNELGRVSYEGRTAAALQAELATLVADRTGWRDRLARLDIAGPRQRLEDAAHLLRHAVPVLGKHVQRVAEEVFLLDPADETGQRADAALVVATMPSKLADEAALYLEAIAPRDPAKRYGFVAFQRSAQQLDRLMAAHRELKAGKTTPVEVRKLAVELIAQVNKARPHAPTEDVLAQLLARAAVGYKLAGETARAEAAIKAAKALAEKFAAQEASAAQTARAASGPTAGTPPAPMDIAPQLAAVR